ncbi:transmembrane protease serine 9-like, partial [Teleopsis dalmanni]|uniref:transmembrane protease serine 9-like n=1 Tax=Teleopsis dalmanni TaxID=139649 RepID=UPI0018CF4786
FSQIIVSSIVCNKRNSRIVGGSQAVKNEIPFIVSLTRRGGHFCGATIIHESWVLTAGHCLCNGLNKFVKPSQINGVVGLHSISEYTNGITIATDATTPIQIDFKKIITHPEYICTKVKNDIALLEIVKPIKFTPYIQPICLNAKTGSNNYENEVATVSGWGWTNENQSIGERADTLRKASVQIWNNSDCEKSYQLNGKTNNIYDTQLCAGFENGGIDSCWADSGGPLIFKENILIGVVSTGIGCGRPGLPGIYTRVGKYIDWIESVII